MAGSYTKEFVFIKSALGPTLPERLSIFSALGSLLRLQIVICFL
jgi:hypothetical protein